jgi:hypothetical protein
VKDGDTDLKVGSALRWFRCRERISTSSGAYRSRPGITSQMVTNSSHARVGGTVDVDRELMMHQPWASLACMGKLRFVVRSFPPPVTGWVGVFATSALDTEASLGSLPGPLPFRAVVGAVCIERSFPIKAGEDPRSTLKLSFGNSAATSYPSRYLPVRGKPAHVWVLSGAVYSAKPTSITMRRYPWIWMRFPASIPIARVTRFPTGRVTSESGSR